jgi:hypothetical protein
MMVKLVLILLASAVMATSVQGVIWPHIEGNSLETTQINTGHAIDNLPAHEGCIGRLLLWNRSSGVFEYDFLQYRASRQYLCLGSNHVVISGSQ